MYFMFGRGCMWKKLKFAHHLGYDDLINDRPLFRLRQIPWKYFPDNIQRYCFYSVSFITSTETDFSALFIYFDIVKLFLESSNPDTKMLSQSSNKRSGRPQLHSRSLTHSSRSSLKLPPLSVAPTAFSKVQLPTLLVRDFERRAIDTRDWDE